MACLKGDAHNVRPRLTLEGWRGRNCSKLAGGEQGNDSSNYDPVQRWEAWLWGERNAWSVDQHRLPEDADDWLRGGAWAKRRLSKSDAAELLGLAFAAIDGGAK